MNFVALLIVVALFINASFSSPYNCSDALYGKQVKWLQAQGGAAVSGYREYHKDGTFQEYFDSNKLIAYGTYKVTENDKYCLEKEIYTYPIQMPAMCSTFSVYTDDNGVTAMIGCGNLGDDCTPSFACTYYWNDWWSAVVIGTAD